MIARIIWRSPHIDTPMTSTRHFDVFVAVTDVEVTDLSRNDGCRSREVMSKGQMCVEVTNSCRSDDF